MTRKRAASSSKMSSEAPVKRTRIVIDEKNPPDVNEIFKQGEATRKRSDATEWEMVNTIRVLSAEMVQAANSGHPGAPMGCAPMAYTLYSKFMNYNPANPSWANRDRFVLSNGHGCALQYSTLHLFGYDLPMEELKRFRQLDSKTPGHPENHMTPGIEVTTGPLGQGISNAVGLAIAEKQLAAVYNKPDFEIISNYTYCIVGDGCLQEGVAHEAISLAGHLGLGKLIVLYDDNHIQIDGSTDLAFTENVQMTFEACGWHFSEVQDGDNDLVGLKYAIEEARKVTDKPSLIKVTTLIGFGASMQGTEKVHGAPLGAEALGKVKTLFGFDQAQNFHVSDKVRGLFEPFKAKGAEAEKKWNELFDKYVAKYPTEGAELKRRLKGELPAGWKDKLPRFTPQDKPLATRKFSEGVLMKLAETLPELVGGSADLTGSNLTKIAGDFQKDTPAGRYFRFGVREHAMAAICNGITAYGAFIPFAATFLNFLGYAQGAFRLSALSHFGVLYIMTHDSIGLGEDGPTHQPVEILELTRATPNVLTMRPADGNETTGCYIIAVENRHSPSVLSLTRQNVPNLEGSTPEKVAKGAYVLQDVENPQVVLCATGSEVPIAVDAAKKLQEKGIKARVVSMPITQIFDQQPLEYRKSVFPDRVPVISVEASSTRGWQIYAHHCMGIPAFGCSAPYMDIYKKMGLTPEGICEKAQKVLDYYKNHEVPILMRPDL